MKEFFAAVVGKSGDKKWQVNESGAFNVLFYVQYREILRRSLLELHANE